MAKLQRHTNSNPSSVAQATISKTLESSGLPSCDVINEQLDERPKIAIAIIDTKGLVDAGLVTQAKEGRSILCFPQLEVLQRALRDIEEECCANSFQREVG